MPWAPDFRNRPHTAPFRHPIHNGTVFSFDMVFFQGYNKPAFDPAAKPESNKKEEKIWIIRITDFQRRQFTGAA